MKHFRDFAPVGIAAAALGAMLAGVAPAHAQYGGRFVEETEVVRPIGPGPGFGLHRGFGPRRAFIEEDVVAPPPPLVERRVIEREVAEPIIERRVIEKRIVQPVIEKRIVKVVKVPAVRRVKRRYVFVPPRRPSRPIIEEARFAPPRFARPPIAQERFVEPVSVVEKRIAPAPPVEVVERIIPPPVERCETVVKSRINAFGERVVVRKRACF